MAKLPQSWLQAGTKQKQATETSARLDMSADVAGQGYCPECKQKMMEAYMGDTPVWACVADRIALPMPDSNNANKEETQTVD